MDVEHVSSLIVEAIGFPMSLYIVTGGLGFIGANLVRELMRKGNEVIIIDSLHTGSLKKLPDGVRFIKGRSGDVTKVKDRVDGVFHLGMYSSSPMYREDRRLVTQVVEDAIEVLEYCKENGVKLVYASTSSIYNGNPLPWREDMPIFVTDFYTEARYYLERLAQLYGDMYGVESVGLRLFSVYGEGEESKGRYANVLTQMVWAKLKEEPFEVYGDGTQTRDLIYVGDVVRAFLLAMESDVQGIFNVGFGREVSFNEMARLTGVRVKYVENKIKNYVMRTLADTTKAEEVLGFRAQVPVEQGVRILERYYSKFLRVV